MKTRIAALAALALLPALLSGCGSTVDDSSSGVGNAYVGASLAPSQLDSDQIMVPDVTGKSVAEAKLELARLNLAPEAQSDDSDPMSDETAWSVDRQSPEAGSTVEFGSRVTLNASKTNPKVTLQDIAGQSGDAAEYALEAQGFEVEWSESVLLPADWIATGTSPKAGSEIEPGSTVTISVMRPRSYTDFSTSSDDGYSELYDDGSDFGDYDSGDDYGYDDYSGDDGSDYSYDDSDSSSDDGSYGDMDGYEINGGEGNGYEVTCADGAISHSGGIQGACSHHGGVRG